MEDPSGTAPFNLCWRVYHMQSDWETCGGFHTSVNYTAEVSPCDPLTLSHEQHFLVPLSTREVTRFMIMFDAHRVYLIRNEKSQYTLSLQRFSGKQ